MISLGPTTGGLAARVSSAFSPGGILSKADGFEFRPQQRDMALAVASAIEDSRHLLVEAGTGVGKSMAYLVPAVFHAMEHKRKAVVSTHTINLQEQLVRKDLPALARLGGVDFSFTLMKGRQNYLCPNRLDRALLNRADLFAGSSGEELVYLKEWASRTKDGTLSDLDTEPSPGVWESICSEAHVCTPKTCGPECFYQRARRQFLNADVIVVNHTLFLLLCGEPREGDAGGGYLFDNDFVIIDEAHTFEAVASRHIGMNVSQFGLRRLLHRLYNPQTLKGMLQVARRTAAISLTADLIEKADSFFNSVGGKCTFGRGRECRIQSPGLVNDTLTVDLMRLEREAASAAEDVDDEFFQSELADLAGRLRETRLHLGEFLSQTAEGHVYWVEKTGRQGQFFTLNAAPVEAAPILRSLLFRPGTSCVMTSATLSDGRPNLAYFRRQIGADAPDDDVLSLAVGSPFDFKKQMRVLIPTRMPDPKDPRYDTELARWIRHFLDQTDGRAFVLFTSYQSLNRAAEALRDHCESKGWELLTQGDGLSRSRMIEAFRSGNKPGVLFGTESFWTGVDVPGDALVNVIITKLPFSVPDHPLTQARVELIESRGGSAFNEHSLPEAILKFRQGVGRLIRSKTDKGIIAVLDNRIISKSYGRAFLAALPECPVEKIS